MDPAVDLAKLSPAATRILDPKSPVPIRQMGARGIAPGLKPADALTVIALLAESEDASLATLARATLDKLPAPLLTAGLTPDLPPGVVGVIAPRYAGDVAMMERIPEIGERVVMIGLIGVSAYRTD